MGDYSDDDDDAFVNSPSFPNTQKPAPSSSSSKRKAATPTSSKAETSKKKKGDDDDAEEEELPSIRFLTLDSDDDEDELVSKNEWRMVEGRTRYMRDPPTSPPERGYANRKIDLREDKDEGDNKLREFFCELAREVNEDQEMGSQQSTTSDLTPLTPPIITGKYPPLTAAERLIAETKIRQAGKEGLEVPGTKSRVAFSPPNINRAYGLFVLVAPNTKWNYICSGISNCVRTRSTTVEPIPKCHLHKGEQIGFVLAQFTDGTNKKNDVVLHVIASFKYIYGDDEGKSHNATRAIMLQHINKPTMAFKLYSKEREAAKKPPAQAVELVERRLYFDDEDKLLKVYSARQTVTLLKLLLWPDTTIKVISLNVHINLPNGAYKELLEEMDLYGLELKIHDKLSLAAATAINLEEGADIPFLLHAEKGESLGAFLKRGRQERKGKVAALYFASNPYIIYAGQARNSSVHKKESNADPVLAYINNKPSTHPEPKIVPVGLVLEEVQVGMSPPPFCPNSISSKTKKLYKSGRFFCPVSPSLYQLEDL
ncbi:hypothetical protein Fcan01_02865 [Folsomia candida]|uniref:Uncharacterized protein n=1 Tax=Folsomia candida TaxID=158441 RepID=A0A226F0S8_FOLCA|nr:hypothetical protein Fcan01_02865 [Folsomia candida]